MAIVKKFSDSQKKEFAEYKRVLKFADTGVPTDEEMSAMGMIPEEEVMIEEPAARMREIESMITKIKESIGVEGIDKDILKKGEEILAKLEEALVAYKMAEAFASEISPAPASAPEGSPVPPPIA